jgi:hypothetical protein
MLHTLYSGDGSDPAVSCPLSCWRETKPLSASYICHPRNHELTTLGATRDQNGWPIRLVTVMLGPTNLTWACTVQAMIVVWPDFAGCERGACDLPSQLS